MVAALPLMDEGNQKKKVCQAFGHLSQSRFKPDRKGTESSLITASVCSANQMKDLLQN